MEPEGRHPSKPPRHDVPRAFPATPMGSHRPRAPDTSPVDGRISARPRIMRRTHHAACRMLLACDAGTRRADTPRIRPGAAGALVHPPAERSRFGSPGHPGCPGAEGGPRRPAGRHPRPGAEGFPSRPAHAAFASISSSVAAIAATAQRISSTVIAPTAPIRMVGAAVL